MSAYWIDKLLVDTRDVLVGCQDERANTKGKNQRAFSELDSAVIDLTNAVRHLDTAKAAVNGDEIIE